MLFDTYTYLYFFAIVYSLYLLIKGNKTRKILLLICSYVFYMGWNPSYSLLLLNSTLITFFCSKSLYKSKSENKKKLFLILGIVYSLSILFFFKYWNFITLNLNEYVFHYFKITIPYSNFLLPVGISFYTFHTLSYLIDCYRGIIKNEHDIIDYSLYVSFFPQLVAGPIVRASNFLPQLKENRIITGAMIWQGIILIFAGFFKKIVFSNNLAPFVNQFFSNPHLYSGSDLLLGAYAFTMQIYCDFSGYTDIAIGTSLLFGYTLPLNFNYPYLAKNPSDFWKRWHISLSSWLRDYLYIPLGGNRSGIFNTHKNLAIVMFLGGLWHGASWNFIIWGIYQGVLLIIHRYIKNIWKLLSFIPSKIRNFISILLMLHFTVIGWIIFRAESLNTIKVYFSQLFTNFSLNSLNLTFTNKNYTLILVFLLFFIIYNALNVKFNFKDYIISKNYSPWILSAIVLGIFIMIMLQVKETVPFIYFQF